MAAAPASRFGDACAMIEVTRARRDKVITTGVGSG